MSNTTNAMLRLLNIDDIGKASVCDVLNDMDTSNVGQVAIQLGSSEGQVRGALICLNGPDTQRYIDAFNAVSNAIEEEQE
ncbi:hypothetical protein [Halomonas sp. BMC6]|jgi:hypothetical protein|uniref:hypothetical protein n=1 Tax=Halomonas sp. BMC6 TaxID=3073244 RepID=UPI0030D3FCAE